MKAAAVKYWDSIAAKSDADARDAVLAGFRSERRFDDAGREDASKLLLPFIRETDTVLDVGCGLGRLLKWVAPHCRNAIGLDVSREMLRKASLRIKGRAEVDLRLLPRTLRFPLASRSVDFAYFYHVSEHMEREDAFRILAEVRRCLRRDGQALVQFGLLAHEDNQREFRRWARAGDPEGVRSRFYTVSEAETLLGMARLHPQLRIYIPGEAVFLVTTHDDRVLGEMSHARLLNRVRPVQRGVRVNAS